MNRLMIKRFIAAAALGCLLLLPGCAGNDTGAATDTGLFFESLELPPETTAAPETEPEPEDTEPPFFLYLSTPVTIEQGNEFNIHKYLSYIDNFDPDVDLTVGGIVNTDVAGEYPLVLVLTDDAGNYTSSKMTVNVTRPVIPDNSGSGGTWTPEPPQSFAEFTAKYKKDGASVGIDVSRWQGDIDFGKVASDGCEFVIIRIGGYAEGQFEDAYYAANIRNAKAAGLKVGVYWYSEENGAAQVRENSEYLYSLLGGEELDFPIFFDWEDYYNFEDYKMSIRDLNEMFLAFREEAKAHGYEAALYNSKYFLTVLWSDEVKEGGVWLAHYIEQTTYTGDYFLWQQGVGRIGGIDGDVDVDVLYPDAMKKK